MRLGLASTLVALSGSSLVLAQKRCDAPYPEVYCNTTSILAFNSDACKPFHIFVVRGSDEPYPGRLGNLTQQVCSAIGGTAKCGYEDVEYPSKSSAWSKTSWCDSATKGAKNGQQQMRAYSEKCPDSKLIVLGFSQGGSVAQDMLGGGGGPTFECEQGDNPGLDASVAPGSNVVAAVTFGAVARSRNQNFTVGGGKDFDGTRARTPEQLANLTQYADVLLDYCHYGDPICAVGSEPQDVTEHLNYFVKHNAEVTKWVAGMAKASTGDVSVRPSKPVVVQAAPSSTAQSSTQSLVPAKPIQTGAPTTTSTVELAPAVLSSITDGAAAAEQTGVANAAAGTVRVVLGYLTVLGAVAVVLV
ncbi:carbohydrate esterase family 5 protein [Bipolaris zeicola 26-R-13]|uniref:Carbohydrate esterase family 5 protein n=1 Tax=Cochliobolus carbonum (strain 26-R-13) TaxID=930089 RepID=W6YGE2_COCC2|nr:carbohydrate esterase family 5 protein [Bipolaris zeicola 26-R-13]EUC30311.1 carbohydrate esterase family 5 protein [Bipolaris zeicola 26-R-13]